MSKTKKYHLYTFNNGKIRYHGLVIISDNDYVNNEFPLEDFGDYLLSLNKISEEEALTKWRRLSKKT